MNPRALCSSPPRSYTCRSGALYPADHLALVLGQSSAAPGSMGPRSLPTPDPEGLACEWAGSREGAAWPVLSPHSRLPPTASSACSGSAVQPGLRGSFHSGGGAAAGPGDPEVDSKDAGECRAPDSGSVSVCQPGNRAGNLAVSLESLLNVSLLASCALLWKNFKYGDHNNQLMVILNPTPCYFLRVAAADISP